MKILHLTPCYIRAFRTGGPAIALERLNHGLTALGHEVTVVASNGNMADEIDLTFEGEEYETVENGIRTIYLRRAKNFLPPTFYYCPRLKGWLDERLGEFDVVSMDGAWTSFPLIGRRACSRFSKPFLAYVHGGLDPFAFNSKRWKKFPYWLLFEKKNYMSAAAIVALTQDEAAQVAKHGLQVPTKVIPIGIECPPHVSEKVVFQKWERLRDAPYLLFLSRLHPKKGLMILLKAWQSLQERYPEWQLALAGPDEGNHKQELERTIQKSNLRNVLFTGHVSGDLKTALLTNAALFVLPSYSEGLPAAVLEALAAGVPVVITPGCHLPEVAESGAGVIVPPEASALAGALGDLMGDAARRTEMGRNATELVRERFLVSRVAAEFAELCAAVAQKRE